MQIRHTKYPKDTITANVSYNMDYRWFFNSPSTYNQKLAVTSSLIAVNIYENNRMDITSGGSLTTANNTSMVNWMNFHGMKDVANYDLSKSYSDNDVSQMFVGHRAVTYNNTTKEIVCVVVRGTNGTLKEWSSNFDMGSSLYMYDGWKNRANHKGFDISANRLLTNLDSYIAKNCKGSSNVAIWIAGHSRGAGIANIMAANLIDGGKTVYTYTFAAPNTTTATNSTKYNSIFNIINTDDFVPKLPVSAWGFRRYGIVKSASVESSYSSSWATLTGLSKYKPGTLGQDVTVNMLAGISKTRNNCYEFPSVSTEIVQKWFSTAAGRDGALNTLVTKTYKSNMEGTYKTSLTSNPTDPNGGRYGYAVLQSPAFLMQGVAAVMGGAMDNTVFAGMDVAPYLERAKWTLGASSVIGIDHAHYNESYYLLATKLS